MTCIFGPTEAKSGQSIRFSIHSDCHSTKAIAWNLGDGTIVYDEAEILHRFHVSKVQRFTITLITTDGNYTLEIRVIP